MRAILKMMRLWIGNQVQLLQAVSAIKGGVKKNKFRKFVLYALQGMDQGGRCTLEKGITVSLTRENEGQKLCRRTRLQCLWSMIHILIINIDLCWILV